MIQKIKDNRRAAVVTSLFVGLMALPNLAFATSTDPTGGAGSTLFTSLTSYLTATLIPAVVALAVIGIAVSMLIKWGKRAAKSS